MNVTCPKCKTVYRLPSDKIKQGAKLRCSQCQHVFLLPEIDRDQEIKAENSYNLSSNGDNDSSKMDSGKQDTLIFGSAPKENVSRSLDIKIDSGNGGSEKRKIALDDGQKNLSMELPPSEPLFLPHKKQHFFGGIVYFLLAIAIAFCVWQFIEHPEYKDKAMQTISLFIGKAEKTEENNSSPISLLELIEVRQYQAKNENLGKPFVIEGKVKNNFTNPRELIYIEAALYDENGKELAKQQQIAGVSLTSTHIESLSRQELEETLSSRIHIISNNINVQPGAAVPFTVVFADPPDNAKDYKLKIVSAAIPDTKGNILE